MTRIAVTGAAGRMGRRIVALAVESKQFEIVAALDVAASGAVGQDAGELAGVGKLGVPVTTELRGSPQVVVDFSLPEGTMHWLAACVEAGLPLVSGTTGLSEQQSAAIDAAARSIPIIHSANMSVGVNVLLNLVAQAASLLGADYDIEVSEVHHRFKKDAPSGTAIALARSICQALGKNYGEAAVLGRGGVAPRRPGEIGMHALRVGDTVGEHTVYFGNLGETVTIGHSAHTRDTFVRGALRAAQWLAGKPAGRYTMADVLGL
jgi:4-hydroxy-tetrahydrodipicolinate reductase